MGWKNWPSWVRGGIISVVVSFVIIPAILNHIKVFSPDLETGLHNVFGFVTLGFFVFLFVGETLGISTATWPGLLLVYFLGFVHYFLIGAVIGWIVGKIRNRQ